MLPYLSHPISLTLSVFFKLSHSFSLSHSPTLSLFFLSLSLYLFLSLSFFLFITFPLYCYILSHFICFSLSFPLSLYSFSLLLVEPLSLSLSLSLCYLFFTSSLVSLPFLGNHPNFASLRLSLSHFRQFLPLPPFCCLKFWQDSFLLSTVSFVMLLQPPTYLPTYLLTYPLGKQKYWHAKF